MQGVIIESSSNLYKVINREDEKIYELIPRGKLKKEEISHSKWANREIFYYYLRKVSKDDLVFNLKRDSSLFFRV